MVQANAFLETERLIIRNWQEDDWLLVRPMSLDPDVMRYIGHYQPWSEQEDASIRHQPYSRL